MIVPTVSHEDPSSPDLALRSPHTTLADEARALVAKPGPRCHVARALLTDIGPELEDAIAQGIPAKAISAALHNRGIWLGDQSITRHRRGDCSCSPTTL